MIGRALIFAAFAMLSSSARADISDSGNLTIGGQATIAGTTTVQGSAFSVGGATFTVGGGSITLGGVLNASVAGVRWADGSTSTTATAGAVQTSSFTNADGLSAAASADFGVCLTTVTLTLNAAAPLFVSYSGLMGNSVNGGYASWNFLLNGAFVSPWTATKGVTECFSRVGGDCFNCSATVPIGTYAVGTYSVCLTIGGQNTGTSKNTGCNGNPDSYVRNRFGVLTR